MFDAVDRRRAKFAFEPFRERFPWHGADLQTIRNAIVHRVRAVSLPSAERWEIEAGDGTGDVLLGAFNETQDPDRPIVLMIHGLTGCEDSPDIRASAAYWLREGYAVLRLNLRGAGPAAKTCRAFYHSGRSADIAVVLAAIENRFPGRPVLATGYSLGGNILLKWAGEQGERALDGPVRAIATVCAPIDLRATSYQIDRPRNRVYQNWLLKRLKSQAIRDNSDIKSDMREASLAARSVKAFDDAFTALVNGWADAFAYYDACMAVRFMDRIKLPSLLITSDDDPWVPSEAYHIFDWSKNTMLTPLISDHGGHCGFHGVGGSWQLDASSRFFREYGAAYPALAASSRAASTAPYVSTPSAPARLNESSVSIKALS